jgi:hypothetical protein
VEAGDLGELIVKRPGGERESASVVNRQRFAILAENGGGKVKGKEHFKVVRKGGAVERLSHLATSVFDTFFRIVETIGTKKFALNF